MYDTHCHLDDVAYDQELSHILANAQKNGVHGFIIPGANPKDLPKAQEISHKYPNIYFAVGVHPYYAHDYELKYLESYICDDRCVAVGECGLDYFRLPKTEAEAVKNKQKDIFNAHIDLAKAYNKPLILHIRDASNDAFEILKTHDIDRLRGVLHCYNADAILLQLSKTFYYGIGGVVTFKNAKRLVEILPKIPLERLLLETDSPYLTPEPHRGKRNSPEYIPIIADKIAHLLNLPHKTIAEITTQNAKTLFALRDS